MLRTIFRKFTYSLFTIWIALTSMFFLIRMAPGDPIERILGPEASSIEVESYRNQLGLDFSVREQYLNYIKGVIRLDLGNSLYSNQGVVDLIIHKMRPTILIALASILLSTPLGICWGLISGIYKKRWKDLILKVLALMVLSIPIFSLAPLLVLVFSIQWRIFPVSEWGEFKHAVLPIFTLVLPLSAILARVMRNIYIEESLSQWIAVLSAKGLKNRSIIFHHVRVCLPTIFNVVAIQLSVVLAGTMITETIFDIPGIGSLLFESIQNRDYPVVQGIMVYSTIIYMGVFMLIDFVNSKIDPRITL